MRAMVDEAKFSLSEMKSRAKKAGVEARVVLDQNPGHVGTAISVEAAEGYGLVALAAHKGFWDRFVIGSTSRFVLRECPTSVWMIRPTKRSKSDLRRPASRTETRASAVSGSYLR
jgi:nucleotide-binding universal stress UspA family protein